MTPASTNGSLAGCRSCSTGWRVQSSIHISTKGSIMTQIRREMHQNPQHSGINLNSILFALFKRKRTIMVCAAAGIIAAAAFYFLYPPSYESQAKLLVRYVTERSAVDPVEAEKAGAVAANASDRVIGAEIEILTSWDLA